MHSTKPKLGLALSGASSRSVFYIGFLEVLQENNIEIDYIAAVSGSTIVAAAYACGTLKELKEYVFGMNRGLLLGLLERGSSKGGVYNLDKFEQTLHRFTKNQNFEEVKPHMGFVAVDLDKGEQVVLSMGSIARAARISCTVPGVFQPVEWGSRTLIDGGLLSIVPSDVVKEAGMDIVIGVNIRTRENIFLPYQIRLRRAFKAIKRIFLISYAEKLWSTMVKLTEDMDILEYFTNSDLDVDNVDRQGMFGVLGRALDIAIAAKKNPNRYDTLKQCDLLIRHKVIVGQKSYELNQMRQVYEEGRQSAQHFLPEIQKLINNFQR
jgi:predicted acylesterase/phospholipase RssA